MVITRFISILEIVALESASRPLARKLWIYSDVSIGISASERKNERATMAVAALMSAIINPTYPMLIDEQGTTHAKNNPSLT
jgi:hypothetical protein